MKWKHICFDLTVVFLVAVGSGLAVNEIRADGIAILPPFLDGGRYRAVDMSVVRSEMARNPRALIFDARAHELYQKDHPAGALSFPVSQFDFFYNLYLSDLPAKAPIFVSGRTLSRASDLELAYRLALKGHRNVTVVY